MKRAFAAGAVAAAVAAPLALGLASPASAAQPRIYHTIKDTTGSANVSSTSGCERTDVWVSSSTAMYAAQPGPVGKQGLTSVFLRVTDTCAAGRGVVTAAAGGGGAVVLEIDAQNRAPLVVDPRLTRASVTTDLTGTDGQGRPVTVHLVATWTGTGPLEHTTVHNHAHYGDGNVNATDNNLRRTASARVSVQVSGAQVDARSVTGSTADALLEQVKSRCIEVPRPGVEGFYPCFGFPG